MKFSDMMGKGDKGGVDADATETSTPSAQPSTPTVPDAPIRFGGTQSVESAQPESTVTTDTELAPPSISDVVAELAPRADAPVAATAASPAELDASAWLEGVTIVDDDLLPS